MSRSVRRVPVDFDWPLNKTWTGYFMPDELNLPTCGDCHGQGTTASYDWLNKLVGRIGMLADDVLQAQPRGRALHPWLAEDRYPPTYDVTRPVTTGERQAALTEIAAAEAQGQGARGWVYQLVKPDAVHVIGSEVRRPTADIVELVAGLSGESADRLGGLFGISSSTTYAMVKRIVEAAGLPEQWGWCPTCNGNGSVGTEEQRAAREAWEATEPPTGEGWQLWETVSEGSPISPVFADREAFVAWLTTDYTWGSQREPLTREQAEAFVGLGHSIGSGVILADGRHLSGEAAVAELGGQA